MSALFRSLEQWRACDPDAMATKQSVPAIVFAFQAAKHDVLALAEINALLVNACRQYLADRDEAGCTADSVAVQRMRHAVRLADGAGK